MSDAEAQKKKFKVFRAPRLNGKGPVFVDYVEGGAGGEDSKGARPSTAAPKASGIAKKGPSASARPSARPATAVKKTGASAGAAAPSDETTVTVNENLADANDPIAVAIQERLKAGGVSSTVKEADAKKQGMPMNKFPKHAMKSTALVTLVQDGANSGAAGKDKVAKPAGVKSAAAKGVSPVKRPGAAASKPGGLAIKPKATGAAGSGAQEAACQLDGDLSNDPIAQTMAVRVQLGGVNNNATDADAKRHNYPIFKAAKHPALKGAALLDIALPAKEAPKASAEASSPSKLARKAGSVSKPAGSKPGGLKAKPEPAKKSSAAAGE